MNNAKKLCIIILMRNNVSMSRQCLQLLSSAVSDFDHEVILLDNDSTEDTRSLREYGDAFRCFKWIQNTENSSFSVGNNRCVREASGQRLLFLNNDVFLRPETLKYLIAPLLEDPKIGATGGKLLFPGEKSVQHAGIGQMLWDHPSNYGVGATPSDWRLQDKCERFALSGAMLCVNRDVFEKVGGFDERFVWGTEDIDLCLKIRALGMKAVYCPDAVAIHSESATLKINKASDAEGNCGYYRQKWDQILIPKEQGYVHSLLEQGVRRVAVFGMGTAAHGLARILNNNGIEVVAFTASEVKGKGHSFLGRPIVPLDLLKTQAYDRLMVASQYYFEIEQQIREYDPLQEPIYPLLR
jgi:GT2 family glycosyltransferase